MSGFGSGFGSTLGSGLGSGFGGGGGGFGSTRGGGGGSTRGCSTAGSWRHSSAITGSGCFVFQRMPKKSTVKSATCTVIGEEPREARARVALLERSHQGWAAGFTSSPTRFTWLRCSSSITLSTAS